MKQFAVILKMTSYHYRNGECIMDGDKPKVFNDGYHIWEHDDMESACDELAKRTDDYLENGYMRTKAQMGVFSGKVYHVELVAKKKSCGISGERLCAREFNIVKLA